MDEVAQIVQGLRVSRPSINFEQLLALVEPSAQFEAHCAADVGKDFWIYTVNGSLLEGEAIVVRASKFFPEVAEDQAQNGLADTISELRKFDANTGLHAQVEVKGLE